MVPQLTSGVIWACMNGEQAPAEPYIQILSFKKVAGQANQDRFRLHISDGEFSHSFAMLATQLNKHIYEGEIESFAVVKVKKMMNNTMNNKKIMILLELEVVAKGSEVGMKIGNPTAWVDGMSRPQAATKPANSYSSSAQDAKPYSNGAPPTTPKANMNDSSNGSRYNSYDSPSATKKPKMESMDVPTGAIAPIQDINPYNNRVTIRARVTNKADVKTWSNSRGEGKLFSMDLLDDSGEIRMAGFNNAVDVFYDMIEVNHVYYISRFTVKPANKQFTSIKHDYELSFNNDTQVIPCVEDTSDIPQVTYDFVTIADIEHLDADKNIDVIGVCKSVADCQNITSRNTGKEFKKRELVLIDQSGKEIALTIWGKTAEEFCDDTQPIIAVKGVKVSDFGGKSLSCLSSSLFQVNPDLEQAHALRGWYDSEGSSLTAQSLSSGRGGGSTAPWKLAVEANEVTSSDMEKSDIFMCKVTLMAIKGDNAVYKACTTDKCNKKVVDMGNGMYRCEKCAADIPTFKTRLMLSCNFADFTDHFWATCFHETGEAVLNEKGDTLGELYFDQRDEFDVLIKNALFQQYVGKYRSKMENYNNEIRKKVTVLELTPINHGEYAKQLLNEIRECSS